MRDRLRSSTSIAVALAAAIALTTIALAGCGNAQGLAEPPASFDPASPHLAADDITFDRRELDVPANRPFILVFENRASPTHNVSIYTDETRQHRLFEGLPVSGPATRWYPVPALAPGTYTFVCDLHQSMVGTLVAS